MISNHSCLRVYHTAFFVLGCTILPDVADLRCPGEPLAPDAQRPRASARQAAGLCVDRGQWPAGRVRDAGRLPAAPPGSGSEPADAGEVAGVARPHRRRRASARVVLRIKNLGCRMGGHRGVATARSWRSGHAAAASWRLPRGSRGHPLLLSGVRGGRDPGHPARRVERGWYPRQGGFPQRRPRQPRPRGRGRRRLALQVSG